MIRLCFLGLILMGKASACLPFGEALPFSYEKGFVKFEGGEVFINSTKENEIKAYLTGKQLQKGGSFGENRYGDTLYSLFLEGEPLLAKLIEKGLLSYSEEGAEPSCLPFMKKALAKDKGDFYSPFDKALNDKIGEEISLKGKVYSVREVKSGATYINFAYDFKTSVSAYVPKNVVDGAFLKTLANKEIILKGKLTKQSGLSIKVDSPSQIIILD